VLNVLLIDSDDEDYQKKASSVSGIDNLLQELKHNLAACTGIPQTLLFGRSPSGQNATGESDIRQWYDTVKGEQEDKLLPNLSSLVRYLDLPAGGEPDDRMIAAAPLWQPTAQEQATTLKTMMEAITLGLEWGIMTTEEAEQHLNTQGLK